MSNGDYDSVVLETSMGDVQLELYWDHAPKVIVFSSHFFSFFNSVPSNNRVSAVYRHVRTLPNLQNEVIIMVLSFIGSSLSVLAHIISFSVKQCTEFKVWEYRISWSREVTPPEPGEEVQAFMARSCTFLCSMPMQHMDIFAYHGKIVAAKMRYTQSYVLLVQEFWPWQTLDQIQMVRERNASRMSGLLFMYLTLLTLNFSWFRFSILHNLSANPLFG